MDKLNFATLNPTQVRATDIEGVGTLRWYQQKCYVWVLNGETATDFTEGQVVFHKLSDGSALREKIYTCLTANLGVMAGVIGSAGLLRSTYGWVQCYGYTGSVSVSGATTGGTDIAIGDYLKGVNSAAHVVRDAAVQAAYQRKIQILTTVTTTTTPAAALKPGFVNCL